MLLTPNKHENGVNEQLRLSYSLHMYCVKFYYVLTKLNEGKTCKNNLAFQKFTQSKFQHSLAKKQGKSKDAKKLDKHG